MTSFVKGGTNVDDMDGFLQKPEDTLNIPIS
jgi:hypothetical protein